MPLLQADTLERRLEAELAQTRERIALLRGQISHLQQQFTGTMEQAAVVHARLPALEENVQQLKTRLDAQLRKVGDSFSGEGHDALLSDVWTLAEECNAEHSARIEIEARIDEMRSSRFWKLRNRLRRLTGRRDG
jgi:uncharacterized protein involved in exopolysaccharide biosynthesis